MSKKCITTILLLMAIGMNLFAQETRPAQVSFIYPLSTNGLNAHNYSNKLSLNILAGVNGGVEGFELGSISNVNKGNVEGCQIAGVCNITTGNSKGIIISGVSNFNKGSVEGCLISGVTNTTLDSSSGALISGVANVVKSQSEGLLLAGVSNVCKQESSGVAIAGVVNYADSHKGLQLSTINVSSNKIDGAQIGVINVANKGKGLQFGVINICNTNDSIIPIGLINVVKNGYYAFELSTNELLLSNLSFKMGTEKFYTIFRAGIGSSNNSDIFSTGLGFGSSINIKNNHNINIELISDQIIYEGKWNGDFTFNQLNHLDLSYQYKITNFLAIKAGPTFNTYLTNYTTNNEYKTIDIPYTLFENDGKNVKTSLWIGFSAGIIINF